MSDQAPRRRLAAILAADVVGYSRLIELDEASTLSALKTHMDTLILPAIAGHHGRVVKTTGDGILVEFGSVVDAVRCAIAVQRSVTEFNVAVAADRRLQFRIGVNLGDVVVEGADLYGDGVNIAARLEQLAQPCGVLLSGTAYDQLQGKLDVPLEFVGEQQVKNIARPVRTYRVRLDGSRAGWWRRFRETRRRAPWAAAVPLVLILAGGVWHFWPQQHGLVSRASLAVLPFANIAGDEATGRLADGLTEDIITDLSRYREMDVIARNSTEVYKDKPVDLRQLGKELNVRYVLEGSVQRQGDQLRITAQLIDGHSGTHLWSERWDKPAKEFFAIQTDIADQVGSRLGGSGIINNAEHEAARRSRPEDLTAYELYLAGRNESLRATPEGNKRALELLQRAVVVDPMLARAWAELSWAHNSSINFGGDSAKAGPAALSAARRATELDPDDAYAHATLGWMLGNHGDLVRSESEFDKALQLNPGSADIMVLYSRWAYGFGHPGRGAEAADRAIRLNPNYQIWWAWNFQYAYFIDGRYEDALRILERLPFENYVVGSWVIHAASYAALGQTDAAKAAVADALKHHPDVTIEGFTGRPIFSEAERRRLVELMRAAGFPACARAETLTRSPQLVRLPECHAK
jgi:TolB-like protein/class 3 adenylate cyclase